MVGADGGFEEVMAVIFLCRRGLLLFDLALLKSALGPLFSSTSSSSRRSAFFFADLVVGPKYPSCVSLVSEGVGEGEMTLGVAGILAWEKDMSRG